MPEYHGDFFVYALDAFECNLGPLISDGNHVVMSSPSSDAGKSLCLNAHDLLLQ
jgi:hypothetical protein